MVVCHGLMECSWLLLAWPRVVCVVAVQNEGLTALHWAAISGHVDVVKVLLAAGANVTAIAVRGDDPCVGAGAGYAAVSVRW